LSHHLRVALVPLYLLVCLLLGGASRAGLWANLTLQLLGLVLIFWSLVVERRTPTGTPGRQLTVLLILMLAVVAIQLIPLPPGTWTKFGGREEIAYGYQLIGQTLPWLPISLAPHRTLSSLLWLIPAVATLLGIVKLGGYKASWMAGAVTAVAILSVAVGAMQLAGGDQSPWYFYDDTNHGVGVGFFANANHQATLLLASIPFLTAIYLSATGKGHTAQRASGLLVILIGALMILVVGLFINGSLAGFGLAVPVVGASVLMLISRRRKIPAWATALIAAVALASIYVPFSAPLGNNLTTEAAKSSDFSRYTSFTRSLEATREFLPFGSGIGTFAAIYRRYEDPAAVERTWMNHVHSDFIEVALEAGAPALIVFAIFLLWWLSRTFRVWRAEKADYFARAATIASGAIMAHSAVDYPLRTAAIAAVFAACCALMAEPRPRNARIKTEAGADQARHLSAD
jgi:O-antigen ligase